ncbi:hypothetical protein CORC01_06325 [Colletotrichum orchidophilum]|uniref:Uncharacterized protein n=1 Tax=Colletotrichum orchidophilum TaxID=1209926 RepID=A0A1G4BA87_9PEZI|nr:uncharacterized protein CORC01_06325 [Colletotrichum orchidophilum]OHE98329.1 hypothetical protein CORC01_06325 [Colletotrichum orchidophilum]
MLDKEKTLEIELRQLARTRRSVLTVDKFNPFTQHRVPCARREFGDETRTPPPNTDKMHALVGFQEAPNGATSESPSSELPLFSNRRRSGVNPNAMTTAVNPADRSG